MIGIPRQEMIHRTIIARTGIRKCFNQLLASPHGCDRHAQPVRGRRHTYIYQQTDTDRKTDRQPDGRTA